MSGVFDMPTPTIVGSMEPFVFDIKRCPIWAIPQLALHKTMWKRLGAETEFLEVRHGDGIGLVTVAIAGQGIFNYTITKWDMNEPCAPELYPSGPKNTRQMKVGDKVRSKNYSVSGVIQDIGPCSHVKYTGAGCDEIELTLDVPGRSGVQFYFHASSFEIVDSA